MRPVFVVVGDVFVHQAFQMSLAEDDHMVEQVPPAAADPTLGNAILQWALEAGPRWLDAEAFHGVDDFLIKVGGSIKDQVGRRGIVGKCLAQLLNHPSAARRPRTSLINT